MIFEFNGDFIAGTFRSSSNTTGVHEDVDPGDLDNHLGFVQIDPKHVDEAVGAAAAAFGEWSNTSMETRAHFIRQYREALRKRLDELTRVVVLKTGKSIHDAVNETRALLFKTDILLTEAAPLIARFAPEGLSGHCNFRPRGVAAIFPPTIFPAHGAHSSIIAAILSGNTVVLNVPPLAPMTAQIMGEAAQAAELPHGVLNMVNTDTAGADSLALHRDVSLVDWSGRAEYARQILSATSEQLDKTVVVECPGQNPAIVCDHVDMDRAVHEVFAGAFLTAGQRFMSTKRLYLNRRVADHFMNFFLHMVRHVMVGYGMEHDTFMGPLISETFLETMTQVTMQAEMDEAEILIPSGTPALDRKGFYITPSVHLLPSSHHHYKQHHHSYQTGPHPVPNLTVYLFDDLEEALSAANDTAHRLVASIFTTKPEEFNMAMGTLDFGIINLNRATTSYTARLPHVGRGLTGNHYPKGLFAPYVCTTPTASLIETGPMTAGEKLPNIPAWREDPVIGSARS